uniref:Uncharacterized protein n=1 Tax=viral metagenome TaxID=1070528 RepID=A0A6H1Z9M1_9ZZZZ
MCWHKWTKWEEYEERKIRFLTRASDYDQPYTSVETKQKRVCIKCGLIEARDLEKGGYPP